jgi:hypothetical protein
MNIILITAEESWHEKTHLCMTGYETYVPGSWSPACFAPC